MIVELLSVGTEILLGNIVNTNAAYLSEQCAALGLSVYYQTVVGDNPKRLEEALKIALDRSDIVMMTGGLGPTKDDLTKETAAKVAGLNLVEDEHTKECIKHFFRKKKWKKITENNWKQAMVPEGSIVIDNKNGTAPGLIIEMKKDGEEKRMILMPGPPNELLPMFINDIYPYLNLLQPEVIHSVTARICGLGESFVETEIADLIDAQANPTIAPYAKTNEVHLRITARAKDKEAANQMIKPLVKELKKRFGHYLYTTKEEALEDVVVKMLMERKMTIATAESCTGGLLASMLVNVPGVSEVLKSGFITYSNKAKHKLVGVQKTSLKKHGPVSEKVAKEMAKGCAAAAKADVGISLTGVAGPDGGTPEKPVGLVYAGCCVNGKTKTAEFRLTGNRRKIREYAASKALVFIRECLLEAENQLDEKEDETK
ncbi:MAG: competence/damage-inducible protein A [Lachnospiraceae bacterium]|nr:competence/damage-inducible protein A [Lachnospiraceae bacterium]